MKYLALCLMLGMLSCGKQDHEKGYRHLMTVLRNRTITTCERLQHDGSTCLTTKGQELCGKTRDEAAEVAAKWIEKNVPEDSIDCCAHTYTFKDSSK